MIRPLRNEDARPVADLLRRRIPDYLTAPELVLHWLHGPPERAYAAQWVAEEGGEIAGWAYADFDWTAVEPGIASLWCCVREASCGRGIGARLYDAAESHLRGREAVKLDAWLVDDAGRRFSEARGFTQTRTERLSRLDTRSADLSGLASLEAEKADEGFRLASLSELIARPEEIHALYSAAHKDMPGDDERADIAFDEWQRETLANPLLDLDGSFNVLAGARPVSFAWLIVDREGRQGEHELTGTLREFRGRGLARLAKLAVIRWCAENGVDTLLTGNDSENGAMLAINDRLGYEPTIERPEVSKTL